MRRRRLRALNGPRRASSPLAVHDLCRGPGNLTVAMGITLEDNRRDLLGDRLFVEDRGWSVERITWTPRIGIRVAVERRWRAFVDGSPSVSRFSPITSRAGVR
jgi:3-methyladenine DNA glycosylase Mpg